MKLRTSLTAAAAGALLSLGVSAADLTADVVVIGAGASGSAAALAAQQAGAKVVLLEKTAFQSGAGSFAGGMFAADSSEQKRLKKTVSKEWLFHQYMDISGGFVNTRLVRRIIDEAGKTVDWLNANGCRLKLVSAGTGGAYNHIGMPATLHGYQDGGAKALQGLLASFEKAGGEALFSTPAQELITENGRVVGVKAYSEDEEKALEIRAKQVVIATGGFGGNRDMVKAYAGSPCTMGEVKQNTGDGITMAWKAGAAHRGENVMHYFWQTFPGEEIAKMQSQLGDAWFGMTDFTRYPNLRVNENGRRFSAESDVTLYSVHGAELAMQPKQAEYVIVDSAMLDKVKKGGFAAIEEQYKKFKGKSREFFMEFNEPNDTAELSKAERAPQDLAPVLEKLAKTTATVFRGDSIAELARAMKVDEKAFADSVAEYNRAAKTGKDPMFFAQAKRFQPVVKAPFYAIRFVARNLGTLGGIRIDDSMRAVTEDETPIAGLWACGADAGGMYGKAYVDFEGGTLGFAYTSGRLAGEGAAKAAKAGL